MDAVKILRYESWRAFKSDITADLFEDGEFRRGAYLFRGHKEANWKLESSFDRWFASLDRASDRVEIANRLLKQFRQECDDVETADSVRGDDIRLLALGQHYGLPTRLLDWTASPYIAAFFAYFDLASEGFPQGQIAIWALNRRSPIWTKELGVEIVDIPTVGNVRLRDQAGKFTYSRTPFASLEEYAANFAKHPVPPLFKILLPTSEARIALADIDSMGISHFRVFPEIIGSALAAKMKVMFEATASSEDEKQVIAR